MKFQEPDSDIIEAIENKKLVVFIGSGVSQLQGVPSWNNYSKQIVDYAYEHKPKKINEFTYNDKKELKSSKYDPRRRLSIIFSLYPNKSELLEKSQEILNPIFDEDGEKTKD